ncbi:helix-turn-helix transcriptional regulator [Antrihabitans spumae]|uniref:LuxR C-terminal-related transcriptional regulator n=1 Tax=Antrihabitans spumae TaxID=3373370 RepID=A0ABW7KV65_9NOCA
MTADLLERSAAKIVRLAAQGLDVAAFWRECSDVLATAVPNYMAPCWLTLDPQSLLVTSHFDPAVPEISADYLAHEYQRDDVWKMADIARSDLRTATVHEITGGRPEISECWRNFVAAYGADQELMVPLRSRNGTPWATVSLFREPDRPEFSTSEREFLAHVARPMAEGARRGLLIGEAIDRENGMAPSLIVVDEDWKTQSMTPGAHELLQRLPGYGENQLPSVVTSVAARTLNDALSLPAVARVRDSLGVWLTLHGAPMVADGHRRVAVIIEQTDADRLAPLLMDAYDLTEREKDITRLVLQGLSTNDIAEQLVVAPQTVQQHLKHIFDKTAVNSRRELVGKVFFGFYEPRLRDNETRTQVGKPIRGGPARGSIR